MKTILSILFVCITVFSRSQEKDAYRKRVDSLVKLGREKELISYFEKELKKNPKDEMVLRYLGGLHLKNNPDPDKAEQYFQQALQLNPSCANCYYKMAIISRLKNNDAKAIELLDMAIKLNTKEGDFYLYRAQTREAMRDKFRAISDYNKAIELEPARINYYLARSQYNWRAGYASLALADIDKAIELEPKNYAPYKERAEFLYDRGKPQEALESVTKAITLDSSEAELYSVRGIIYFELGKTDLAMKDYQKNIQLAPGDHRPYYNRSLSRYRLEDMDGSCEDIIKSYELYKKRSSADNFSNYLLSSINDHCDSSRASYYYQRGIANFNLGNYEKAIAVYTRGMQKFPGNTLAMQFRGNSYFALGDYKNALVDFYAAISDNENLKAEVKMNPRYARASDDSVNLYIQGFTAATRLSIAESKFALGDHETALTEINKGLDVLPNISELRKESYYQVRGNIYLALSRNQEALSDFNRCIALDPNYYQAYATRAVAKINATGSTKLIQSIVRGGLNGQNVEVNWTFPLKTSLKKSDAALSSALSDCNKAIELNPEFAFAYYVRGSVKKALQHGDYCFDLLKTKTLGYAVDPELLQECK